MIKESDLALAVHSANCEDSWNGDHNEGDAPCWRAAREVIGVVDAENRSTRNLISDLTDEGECHFDHHGGCQEHGYLALQEDEECPHSEAKRWVKEYDDRNEVKL